jgi:hypothetical protein
MVLISKKYNFIILNNLRCGSVSIETYFSNDKDIHKLISEFKQRIKIETDFEYHERFNNSSICKKICNLLNYNYNKLFSFFTIRNPWDRIVSLYFFLRPDKNLKIFIDNGYEKGSAFFYNFNEWLKKIYQLYKSGNDIFKNYKIESYAFDEDGNQQVTKIYNIENFSINQLCHDINEYNSLLNMNNELDNFHKMIFEENIDKLNITYHNHYSSYYSIESIEYVREMFCKDIEFGKYSFIYSNEISINVLNNYDKKLTSKGWIPNNCLPEAKLLFENRHIFIEELINVINTKLWFKCGLEGVDYFIKNNNKPSEKNIINSTYEPAWRLFFILYYNNPPKENEKYLKNSINFLKKIYPDRIRLACFSLSEPGMMVGLHTDNNSDPKHYRIHIPLILPKSNNEHKGTTVLTYEEAVNSNYAYIQVDNDFRIWRDDDYFIVFHEHSHATYNNSNENRFLLLIDIYV